MKNNTEKTSTAIHTIEGVQYTINPMTNELVPVEHETQIIAAIRDEEYQPHETAAVDTKEKIPLTLRTKIALGATAVSILMAYPTAHVANEWVTNTVVNAIPVKPDVHLEPSTYFRDIGVSIEKLIPGGAR